MLSKEQLDHLKQIQATAESNKRIRENLAKQLGIPEYEVVAPNIFRAASMFGLLKRNPSGSILDLFSSAGTSVPIEYSNYSTSPVTTEIQKLKTLQRLLSETTSGFVHWVAAIVKTRLALLEENDIALPLEDITFQGFQNACVETMESYEICLKEVTEESSDSTWILTKLACLRDVLFGFIDAVNIIQLAKQHLFLGSSKNLSLTKSLNPYEMIVLGTDRLCQLDPTVVETALYINHHTRNPQVVPFTMKTFVQTCCTPVLMFCPLERVLEYGLFNPYCNNNIGYHRTTKLFYILYQVRDGKRFWVADPNLHVLVHSIGGHLVCCLHKMFRYLFKCVFGHNEFRSTVSHPRHKEFTMLLRNWRFAKQLPLLAKIIAQLTLKYAEIYATELDYFNIVAGDMISELPLAPIRCANLYDMPKIDQGWKKL